MKKSILYLASTFLCLGGLFAQTTVSLGVFTGAGSTNVLLSTSTTINRYSRTMSIYTASEIIAAGGFAGVVSSLAWDKSGTGEYTTNDAYIKIFIKHTTNAIWPGVPSWDTEVIGATEVFTSNTYSIPTGTGWKSVPFTAPFVWNGVDNIVVMVEWDRASAPTAAINWGRSTDAGTNATRVGSSSLAALVMLLNGNRPLLQLVINGANVPVTGVVVATQGGVPAAITTNGGTLQMEATVTPVGANQAVTWSLTNGTGAGTISPTGLVTAQSNGTVWAKAVSVADTTIMDSLQIGITNQIIPVTGLSVSVAGGAPAVINTRAGTLQMEATVLPANANQDVIWSIAPITGGALINSTGLLTAQADGTVWAKAVSVVDATVADSLLVTILDQTIGLEAHAEAKILLYPNPITNASITLVLPQNLVNQMGHITITGADGKVVLSRKYQAAEIEITTDYLAPGSYILRYEAGSYNQNLPFIVR